MTPAISVLLHNFIHVHNVDNIPVMNDSCHTGWTQVGEVGRDISSEESNQALELKESIVKVILETYQNIINV